MGVGIFSMILIGAIAGWIAERFTQSNYGLLASIVIGIAGAFFGNWLAALVGIDVSGFFSTLFAATFGATLLIVIYRAVMRGRTTS